MESFEKGVSPLEQYEREKKALFDEIRALTREKGPDALTASGDVQKLEAGAKGLFALENMTEEERAELQKFADAVAPA